jgi:uncharacterized membrane protein
MKWYLFAVAALHAVFMFCEMFPWRFPLLLRIVTKKLSKVHKGEQWTDLQRPLVATIVHNAGIYNAILAGGLFWAAIAGDPARDVAGVLLIGAAVAGIFGTATLKSPITALQAILGIIGFVLVGLE